jgi:hypothetical protein
MEINIHLCSSGLIIAEDFLVIFDHEIIGFALIGAYKNLFYEKCAYIRFY